MKLIRDVSFKNYIRDTTNYERLEKWKTFAYTGEQDITFHFNSVPGDQNNCIKGRMFPDTEAMKRAINQWFNEQKKPKLPKVDYNENTGELKVGNRQYDTIMLADGFEPGIYAVDDKDGVNWFKKIGDLEKIAKEGVLSESGTGYDTMMSIRCDSCGRPVKDCGGFGKANHQVLEDGEYAHNIFCKECVDKDVK